MKSFSIWLQEKTLHDLEYSPEDANLALPPPQRIQRWPNKLFHVNISGRNETDDVIQVFFDNMIENIIKDYEKSGPHPLLIVQGMVSHLKRNEVPMALNHWKRDDIKMLAGML